MKYLLITASLLMITACSTNSEPDYKKQYQAEYEKQMKEIKEAEANAKISGIKTLSSGGKITQEGYDYK